jgi:hypothetical protein
MLLPAVVVRIGSSCRRSLLALARRRHWLVRPRLHAGSQKVEHATWLRWWRLVLLAPLLAGWFTVLENLTEVECLIRRSRFCRRTIVLQAAVIGWLLALWRRRHLLPILLWWRCRRSQLRQLLLVRWLLLVRRLYGGGSAGECMCEGG